MKELMVVAIGGNSIIKDNASQSIEHQAQAVKAVAESVLEMLASDYDIVLTHGNGPQVGLDLRRAEIAHEREGLPLTPLANCVADTQGGIGYLIQQALNNRLAARGEQKAVTVVTQVEVDKNDPGFTHPTKPIGAFFSEAQRDELQRAHPDWQEKWLETRRAAKGERAPGVESGLDELPPGIRGVVMAVEVDGTLRKRLVEMGVTPGVLIAVERVAPLGDPMAVEVRGYRLSLRKAEAARIRVKWRPGLI